MDWSAFLPTFVITLREGVEAALVVGIVLAYLKKVNQSGLNAWVYAGVGSGLAASVLVGVILNGILLRLAASESPNAVVLKPLLEAFFCGVAIALLSWMLVWMTKQARLMKSEVEGGVNAVLQQASGAGWGLFGLVAIAVLREGFETVLFIAAQGDVGWMAVGGAIAGLCGAVLIGFLLFQIGVKINLRQFFQGMGVLLLLIVSGLVITALRKLDGAIAAWVQLAPEYGALCWTGEPSCLLGPLVWDLSQVLPDRQFPGILLKAFFGYTQRLYGVQAIAYLAFLGTVGGIYFRSLAFPSAQMGQGKVSEGR
ncbi:MAG: FTR1 family iron permease [Oculatellaceae cyanobacterium Prado106]|jgi:high-affinity iron transporter|nr:FTR1 family iron permease [Oculatellaceae cyanobacterium Prado106]